jgi:hypothetical protein
VSFSRLPSQLSSYEGVLLLVLHLQANHLRLSECRRLLKDDQADEADRILEEKTELLQRFQAILGGIDGTGHGARSAGIALCELTGLVDLLELDPRPPRFPMRRRELPKRLDELESLETRFLALAEEVSTTFADARWADEFRGSVDMGTKHHHHVVSMKQTH